MTEQLFRRNTVLEALRGSRRDLHKLWLQRDQVGPQLAAIVAAAKARGVQQEMVDKRRLTQLAGDGKHQGVVLTVGPYRYSSVPAMLALAQERDEKPLLLLLDLLHGPQNIGTLLRTAEICGVHGVIMQQRRAPDVTPSVVMYSAGAAEHLLVAQVTNLSQTIQQLQADDVWIGGLDMDESAWSLADADLDRALGLVVGHEGDGMRRRVRESCDFLLELPMRGQVDSLNAAVAGSIALYAAWQARGFAGRR